MKRLYYILIITAVLLSCEKPISDFQSENFIKMFGSGYKSKGNDVIELSQGGYIITGYDVVNNSDQMVYVAKVDKNGNLVWQKTYGILGNVNEGKVVKEVADGYIIAGTSMKSGITYPIIVKLDFDGNEIFTKEHNGKKYSITLTDIVIVDNNISISGYSDRTKTGNTDNFIALLNESADTLWTQSWADATNSLLSRVFYENNELLVLGTNGKDGCISVARVPKTFFNIADYKPVGSNETLVDAAVSYMGLFTLSKSSSAKTKLTLLDDSCVPIWSYVNNDLNAKSLTFRYDGTVLICAEQDDNGINYIHFLKVSNGTLSNGDAFFKTFPGTVSRMIETKDKGFILIGSTNDTYGMNIQLIKTDMDYFMFKK